MVCLISIDNFMWILLIGLILALVALAASAYKYVVLDSKPCIPKPGLILIKSVKEDDMMFKYTFTLPALGAPDVVKRNMHLTVDGVESLIELDPVLTEYEMVFEQDAIVSMFLVDIDDAGNASANGTVLDFTVIDIVPPAAPDAVIISDVIEIHDEEEPVDEPVEEEPVVDEPVVDDVIDEPITDETDPVMDDVNEPVDEPVDEPVEEPEVVDEPVLDEPLDVPAEEEPVMDDTVDEPVAEEPVMEEPVADDLEVEPVDEVVLEEEILEDDSTDEIV